MITRFKQRNADHHNKAQDGTLTSNKERPLGLGAIFNSRRKHRWNRGLGSFQVNGISFTLEKEHLKNQSCVYQRSSTRCHSKDGKPRGKSFRFLLFECAQKNRLHSSGFVWIIYHNHLSVSKLLIIQSVLCPWNVGSLKKFFSVTLRESTPTPRLGSPSSLNHPVCFQNWDQKLFSDVGLMFTGKKENSSLLKKKWYECKEPLETYTDLKWKDMSAVSKIYQKWDYSGKGETCSLCRGKGCPGLPGAVSCVGGRLAVSREGVIHPTATRPPRLRPSPTSGLQPATQPVPVAGQTTPPPAYFWGATFALGSWALPRIIQTISSESLWASLNDIWDLTQRHGSNWDHTDDYSVCVSVCVYACACGHVCVLVLYIHHFIYFSWQA